MSGSFYPVLWKPLFLHIDDVTKMPIAHRKEKQMETKEAPWLTHYRDLIRTYFEDQTEEGRIAKYAKMEECCYMLLHFLNVPDDIVKSVYQEEYANKYFA